MNKYFYRLSIQVSIKINIFAAQPKLSSDIFPVCLHGFYGYGHAIGNILGGGSRLNHLADLDL